MTVWYPSVRYFREPDGRVGAWTVRTPEEDAALGPGYYDSPVRVPAGPVQEPEAPIQVPAPPRRRHRRRTP